MTDTPHQKNHVRLYLCDCGPLISGAIDLDGLRVRLLNDNGGIEIMRHTTLCSEEGRAWMSEDLSKHPDARVVVAACSPREHESTFRGVCRTAGVNPYLLAMANIREQCAWVVADRERAVEKAEALVRAAIVRARRQRPLEERFVEARPEVMIVGAGVAGLTAARILAEGGRHVCVVERAPVVGGRAALLGDLFPEVECASCMLDPLMDEVLHDPNVEVLTSSEVTGVVGAFGNFTVRVLRHATHVDPAGCYGCRSCHEACPVTVPNEYDAGLSSRRAIYIPYTGCLPSVSRVDAANCLRSRGEECDACVAACPFGNIRFDDRDEVVERNVGAIVVATGSESKANGAGGTSRVLRGGDFERILSSAGPTGGEVRLPDAPAPASIALLHCTDAAGAGPVEECSAVCCMAFAKYVRQVHEKLPGCVIHEVLWERCAGGREAREFLATADRVPTLRQTRLGPGDRIESVVDGGNRAVVTLRRSGERSELAADMAVIIPPLRGAPGVDRLAGMLRLDLDPRGFVLEDHKRLRSFRSRVAGVYVAGCAQGPKDVRGSAEQGAAAAGAALAALAPGRKLPVEPATAVVDEALCGGCRTCVTVCPYKAAGYVEDARAARVDELLCQGCGACAAACPSGAISARHFTDAQILGEIATLLA